MIEIKKIKFRPLTPVFIGSGESYYPMDYFIDDKIYFIDKEKFNKRIVQKNLLDEFVKKSENIDDLYQSPNHFLQLNL